MYTCMYCVIDRARVAWAIRVRTWTSAAERVMHAGDAKNWRGSLGMLIMQGRACRRDRTRSALKLRVDNNAVVVRWYEAPLWLGPLAGARWLEKPLKVCRRRHSASF